MIAVLCMDFMAFHLGPLNGAKFYPIQNSEISWFHRETVLAACE